MSLYIKDGKIVGNDALSGALLKDAGATETTKSISSYLARSMNGIEVIIASEELTPSKKKTLVSVFKDIQNARRKLIMAK